jgi:protein SCO1/2
VRTPVIAVAAFVALGLTCTTARRRTPREPIAALAAPSAIGEVDVQERLGAPVPAQLTFVDQDRARVRLGDLFRDGRPVVMVLAYFRCPMLCDLVQQGLAAALRESGLEVGRDFRAVTVSIDPRDTPGTAAVRGAALWRELGRAAPVIRGAWRMLTGGDAEIHALAAALGFRYVYDPRSRQYAHPACAFVLGPDGRVARYLYGPTFRPRDLRWAVVEAGRGAGGGARAQPGSVVDRVLLTCFRYDPSARRYGIYVLGVMRGGSALVLLTFGLGMAALWRRGRARGSVPGRSGT